MRGESCDGQTQNCPPPNHEQPFARESMARSAAKLFGLFFVVAGAPTDGSVTGRTAAVNGIQESTMELSVAGEQMMLPESVDGTMRQLAEMVSGASSSSSASKSSASHHSAFRYKLSAAYCPNADAVEKELLACKNFAIGSKMKSVKDETEKKALSEERKKLYAAQGSKSAEEKKASAMAHKALFTKAYALFCSKASHAQQETCTNEEMKKLYSGAKKGRKVKQAS